MPPAIKRLLWFVMWRTKSRPPPWLGARARHSVGSTVAYNKAGILGPMGDVTDETAEAFDQVNSVNLRGVWTCMKHELLQMRKQGSGAIVNFSSLGGLVGLPGRAAYHATTHG